MKEYFVYMLRCSDGSYYTGVSNDYQSRLNDHQQGIDTKSYTYKRRPVKLAYLATFTDIYEAIAWEKRVKRWSRKKKEALIRGEFERLPELSECQNETHYKFHKQQ
jgi:putative endonuclease